MQRILSFTMFLTKFYKIINTYEKLQNTELLYTIAYIYFFLLICSNFEKIFDERTWF